jgi:hypothetical protein
MTVTPGNTPDGDHLVRAIQERQALTGTVPQEMLGDTAYGGATTRAAAAEAFPDLRVESPIPPASHRAGRFAQTDFTIDLAAQTVTCPAGQTRAIPPRRRTGRSAARPQHLQFPATVCGACSLRDQCVSGQGGRNLTLHAAEADLQAHRARQADPAWQAHYRERSVIEHVMRGVTRTRDRATHYWGRRKTARQLIWQAVGYNIRELLRFTRPPQPQSRSPSA